MLIDGKQLAQNILENLKKRVERLQAEKNIIPHLAIIRVGNDPATTSYVNQKERMGKKIGAVVSIYDCPENVSEKEILETIKFLQTKGGIHGLIIQLPLPSHIREEIVTMAVDSDMDVDGFKPDSDFVEPIAAAVIRILEEVYKLEQTKPPLVIPSDQRESRNLSQQTQKIIQSPQSFITSDEEDPSPTRGLASWKRRTSVGMTKVDNFKTWLRSKNIVVLGKGKTGGRPIINLLHKMGIEPIIVDSKTHNREEVIGKAEILVCAVGNKGTIVTEGMLRNDAILIGIGMHVGEDGKLHGDYDPEEIKDKAAYYTPIPGGVGPVNAAMLLVNVVEAAQKQS